MTFRSVLLACTLVLGSLSLSSTAQAAGVTIVLEPIAGTAVGQGTPFQFRARVTNDTAQGLHAGISFDIAPVDQPDAAVHFNRWSGTVAPGGSITTQQQVTPSQWFIPIGEYQVTARTEYLVEPLRFSVTEPGVTVPVFDNVTTAAGLAAEHHAPPGYCDTYAAGAAWGDVDNDRDLDLYLPDNLGPSKLWINTSGRFSDEAVLRGVDNGGSYGAGANFADYDNDGDQDLFVVNRGVDRLYRNDGSGHFTDVTEAAGVGDPNPGSSASWGDYDNDGWLDLYVTNWATCERGEGGRYIYVYAEDSLFHNNGDGTFTDKTEILERTGITTGAGFQAAWFDYDRDGDQDLYLGNDYGGPAPKPNVFWRNDGLGADGEWVFTNVSEESNLGLAMNTMGIALGDYDHDMDLDMGLSNIQENALMRNEGDGTFVDVASDVGVARPFQRAQDVSITWGMSFTDFNNDQWEDLYVTSGSLTTVPEPKANELFVNDGNGRFLDLSAPSRADDTQVARGISVADYDRDGRMDVYVVNQGGFPYLYRNATQGSGHWLHVDTVGTSSNRDGCGAKVIARVDRTTRLLRYVFCGSVGLAGGSDSTVHFGLGDGVTRLRSLKIVWPSGNKQVLRDVRVDRLKTVTEPAG